MKDDGRQHTLEDFTKEKMKDQNRSKTTTNDNTDEVRLNHETNPASAFISQEIASLVKQEVEKAVNEIKSQLALCNSKSRSNKKRNPIYIRNEDYPTILKFRKNDEPLKETLRRVIRAAARYFELKGDSEVH